MEFLNVYLTNLGKYNEGELVGEWFHLPADEEEIEAAKKRIGIGETDQFGQPYEEYFITDYDSYIGDHGYGEYADIYEINERIKEIADCVTTEDELKIFNVVYDAVGSLDSAIEIMREREYTIYHNCKTMTEVAIQIVEELGLLKGIPYNVATYFDYKSYGQDLKMDYCFVEMDPNTYLQIRL